MSLQYAPSLRVFPFEVVYALYYAEVLPAPVVSHNVKASRVGVLLVHVDHNFLEVLELLLGPVVELQNINNLNSLFLTKFF